MTTRPSTAFGATDHMMAFGRVMEASSISSAVEDVVSAAAEAQTATCNDSHMCTEQSYPMRTFSGVTMPINAARPCVSHPPTFV